MNKPMTARCWIERLEPRTLFGVARPAIEPDESADDYAPGTANDARAIHAELRHEESCPRKPAGDSRAPVGGETAIAEAFKELERRLGLTA